MIFSYRSGNYATFRRRQDHVGGGVVDFFFVIMAALARMFIKIDIHHQRYVVSADQWLEVMNSELGSQQPLIKEEEMSPT